ncbi:MAG: glycosyltransferase [bacterium]
MRFHQLLPTLAEGDAIGNHARLLRREFERRGWGGEDFAERWQGNWSGKARRAQDLSKWVAPEDYLVYHFSTASAICSQAFVKAPAKKAIVFHNFTPPRFYLNDYPEHAHRLIEAEKELESLRTAPGLIGAWGVSEFDRLELVARGFETTDVLPYCVDLDAYQQPPSGSVLSLRSADMITLLAVGRIAPNKRVDLAAATAAELSRRKNGKVRLFVVGDNRLCPAEVEKARRAGASLGERDLIVTGKVSFGELLGYYRIADALLFLSEHEGFGVPVVEAMWFGVPIVARRATAIPETLGNCGWMTDSDDPEVIADLVEKVLEEKDERAVKLAMGRERAKGFGPPSLAAALDRLLQPEA